MSDKIGVGLAAWEFPWLSFDEICQKTRAYGLGYLDAVAPPREQVDEVRATLDRHGVQLLAIGGTARSGSIKMNASTQADIPLLQEYFIEAIEVAALIGARYVISYYGGNLAYDPKASMQRYKRNMQPVLEAAARHDITILIETEYNQVATDVTRSAEGTLDLIEFIDSEYFKVNFDPCNLMIAGEEGFPHAYRVLKEHIRHVHLKDATKYDPAVHGREYRKVLQSDATGDSICVALGQGALNMEGLLAQLREDGYQGIVTIELHTLAERTEHVFDESVRYLRSHGYL